MANSFQFGSCKVNFTSTDTYPESRRSMQEHDTLAIDIVEPPPYIQNELSPEFQSAIRLIASTPKSLIVGHDIYIFWHRLLNITSSSRVMVNVIADNLSDPDHK